MNNYHYLNILHLFPNANLFFITNVPTTYNGYKLQ